MLDILILLLIIILCVTYFLTSITMPDPQTSDMIHIYGPRASAGFIKLRILCLNDFLDGDVCNNFCYFHIFSFFLVFKHDFIRCIDFTCMAASNTASDDVTN